MLDFTTSEELFSRRADLNLQGPDTVDYLTWQARRLVFDLHNAITKAASITPEQLDELDALRRMTIGAQFAATLRRNEQ